MERFKRKIHYVNMNPFYVLMYSYHRNFVAFYPSLMLCHMLSHVAYVPCTYPCTLLIKSCKFCGIFTHPLHYVTCCHTSEITFVNNNYINEKNNDSSDKIYEINFLYTYESVYLLIHQLYHRNFVAFLPLPYGIPHDVTLM